MFGPSWGGRPWGKPGVCSAPSQDAGEHADAQPGAEDRAGADAYEGHREGADERGGGRDGEAEAEGKGRNAPDGKGGRGDGGGQKDGGGDAHERGLGEGHGQDAFNLRNRLQGIGGAVGSLEYITVEDWDRTQAVCLRGVFLGIKHSIGPMREAGGGAIISTASIAGIDGFANLHAYCAAKAGVVNLTRSAALEFAADKIRVNCIAPGGVSTPIVYGMAANKDAVEAMLIRGQPYPKVGQPEDIANAALFLASDASEFITGHTLVVDGGATAGAVSTAPKPGQARAPRPQRAFAGPSFEQG